MAKQIKENPVISVKEPLKVEVIKTTATSQTSAEKSLTKILLLKIYQELEEFDYWQTKNYISNLFKFYVSNSTAAINSLLLVENCLLNLSDDFCEILLSHLLTLKLTLKGNHWMKADAHFLRALTRSKELYPHSRLFANTSKPLLFETDDKKWYVDINYKLYSIAKEVNQNVESQI